MTTITEAIKPIFDDEERVALERGDLDRICASPGLAARFARELAELAARISPGRHWTPETLREVLEVAVHGNAQEAARILEGRYFRKRLKEQTVLAERHKDEFSVVVITIERNMPAAVRSSVLDAVTERLRRTDMVFLYRRRFALVLPRLGATSLGSMLSRISDLITAGSGAGVVERLVGATYPSERFEDARGVLDWAEDQLRDQPMDD